MAIGTAATLGIIGGGALLGGLAGGMGKKSSQDYTSGVRLDPATGLELQGGAAMSQGLSDFSSMVNAGPGVSDVTAGVGAQRDLASLLAAMGKEGGADPTAGDISRSNDLAGQLFQAQRVGMQQAFADQNTNASRQAALMGRSANDPILAAKLAQEQTRQSALLDANQGAWATQYAMNQPLQRLGFASDRANVLGGLATQAMANRQALAAMGSAVQGSERQFRLATAEHYGNQTTQSGGGLGDILSGALGGAGAFAGIAGMFGGGGGAAAAGAAGGVAGGGAAGAGAARAMASAATPFQQYAAPIGPQIPAGYVQTSQGYQMPTTQASPFVAAPAQPSLFSQLWSGAQNYHQGMVNQYLGGR